jgi:ubiquitin C-terminal hydrolase
MGNMLNFSRENDMQELLILLIDAINKECKTVMPRHASSSMQDKAWVTAHEKEYSELVPMYHGQLVRKIECIVCRKKHINIETFATLTVDLPSPQDVSKTTLDQVISSFCQGTKIQHWKCDGCNHIHNNIQQSIIITRMPRTLVVALNRFGGGGLFKNTVHVTIPKGLEIMNMITEGTKVRAITECNTPPWQPCITYTLFSVGCHIGSYDYGHYFAICNTRDDEKWNVIDDDEITDSSVAKILSPSAVYTVFYKMV